MLMSTCHCVCVCTSTYHFCLYSTNSITVIFVWSYFFAAPWKRLHMFMYDTCVNRGCFHHLWQTTFVSVKLLILIMSYKKLYVPADIMLVLSYCSNWFLNKFLLLAMKYSFIILLIVWILRVKPLVYFFNQAWELSMITQISTAVKLIFHVEKLSIGKRTIKTGNTNFSSALNTCETKHTDTWLWPVLVA